MTPKTDDNGAGCDTQLQGKASESLDVWKHLCQRCTQDATDTSSTMLLRDEVLTLKEEQAHQAFRGPMVNGGKAGHILHTSMFTWYRFSLPQDSYIGYLASLGTSQHVNSHGQRIVRLL